MSATHPRHRSRLRGAAWATAVVTVSLSAQADPAPQTDRHSQPLTLQQCIAIALSANRDLQVERIAPDLARANLAASYGPYDPVLTAQGRWENASDSGGFDPTDFSRDAIYDASSETAGIGLTGLLPGGLTYGLTADYAHSGGDRNLLNFDSHKASAGIQLRQPLLKNLWIDATRHTIRVNRRNLSLSELGVRFVVLDVLNRVHQAYYELRQAHEQLQVHQRLLETRRQLLHVVQRQFQEGLATLPEEDLAKAQVAATEAAIGGLQTAVILAENDLRTHLGDSFTNQIHTSLFPVESLTLPPVPLDLEARWHQGLAERPDLRQCRQELAKTELDLKFWRNQLLPSVDLIAGYGRKGASVTQVFPPAAARASADDAFAQLADGSSPSDMVGIVFSMPLSRKAERERHRASRHLRAQAELRLKQKEETVLREISDAFHSTQRARERALAARRGVLSARAAVRAEERRLAGGKSTLLLVLQLQDQMTALETTAIRAEADCNRARSQLAFADASALDQAGVTLVTSP